MYIHARMHLLTLYPVSSFVRPLSLLCGVTNSFLLQSRNSAIVMRALNAVPEKDAEIKKVVDALEPELEDHLMKYIYRILGDAESCGTMLKWHKVLFTKSGLGCIVRAITDRKSV